MNVLFDEETEAENKSDERKKVNDDKEEAVDEQDYFSDSPNTRIDFNRALNQFSMICNGDKEVILFAYYLYKRNLVPVTIKENEITFGENIYFCNAAKRKIKDRVKESLLEKLYSRDLFPTDQMYNNCIITADQCENISAYVNKEFCSQCSGRDNKNLFSCCPYQIAAIAIAVERTQKINIDQMFRIYLDGMFIPFDNERNEVDFDIDPADIEGIESKSAYGAYLMLRDGFIRSSVIDDTIYYSAIRLCDCGDKTPKIRKILDFWKSKSCTERTVSKEQYRQKINESTCKSCSYMQCPERLAAYFDCLSFDYNCSPIDLAYYVARHNTYCNQSFRDDRQYNVYISSVMKSSLNDEDKEDCCKLINYITSKKAARERNVVNRPVLPINIAVKCKDYEAVKKFIFDVFVQVTWYNNYFGFYPDNYEIIEIDLAEKITDDIIDYYKKSEPGNIFILTNLSETKITNCYSIINTITEKEQSVATFIVDDPDSLSDFFAKYPKLKSKIFNKVYQFNDLDSKTVFEEILSRIEETLDVPDDTQATLRRYINATYGKSEKESTIYVKELYERLIFSHFSDSLYASEYLEEKDIPTLTPKRTKEDIFKDLDKLTGLTQVKQKLKEIAALVEFEIKRNKNIKGHQSMHMIFNGNPGTGKTTVARLTAEILYSIGFIQENKLVQCSAKDLIGEYLGQTGPKTAKKCEEAYNGVLFIDEAYQLNPYSSNSQTDMYKEECVAELIQQMENNRDRLIVIFAGYTDEMNEFLEKANTGLRSRLQQTIEFPDYSTDELMEIFLNICNREEMKITEDAKSKLIMIFTQEKCRTNTKFGNARYARNVFDKSYRVHAVNCSDIANIPDNHEKLFTFTADEITPG